THALTIDTDGQHDPADIPTLLEQSRSHPHALIIGARSAPDSYPLASRIGRFVSNHLIQLECGVHLPDSQFGLRVYPLNSLQQLRVRTGRYGYESEVITRLAWAGIEIVQVPIRCIYDVAGGRTTHFRPLRDSAASLFMHARLIARSLWPTPVKSLATSNLSNA